MKDKNSSRVEECVKNNKPSDFLADVEIDLSADYQSRLDSIIKRVNKSDRIIISDSINVINKAVPGLSDDKAIAVHYEALREMGEKNMPPVFIVSGENFINFLEENKGKMTELFKMEDQTTFQKEFEAGANPETWSKFNDQYMNKISLERNIISELRKYDSPTTSKDVLQVDVDNSRRLK